MRFNLIDQPFIPCLTSDGGREELGLRDVLLRAERLREIRDESPLVTVALHRLLLALLHRNFGPANLNAWKRLWAAGRFDPVVLDGYFAKWHDRFELFGDRPFYQQAGFRTKKPSFINRLAQELARGNNATLFDHTHDDSGMAMMPAEAARYLIAEQAYALGGGKSDLGNTTHAPLVQGLVVLPQGATLFHTLMQNLVIYNEEKPIPAEGDAPAWEQDRRPAESGVRPDGYVDLLTWQSRTIRLHPLEADGVAVRQVSYAQGRAFDGNAGLREPAMAYRRDPQKGDRPLRLSEVRALWRDSGALFEFASNASFERPGNLAMLARLVEDRTLPRGARYEIAIVGMCGDQAKVKFWRHERLPMPLEYLNDLALVESLKAALKQAEAAGSLLHSAVKVTARESLTSGGRDAHPASVADMVESLGAERMYWATLEVPFRRLVVDLASDGADRQQVIAGWVTETLRPAIEDAYHETAGQLDRSARQLRAVALGRRKLVAGLRKLCEPLKEDHYEPVA